MAKERRRTVVLVAALCWLTPAPGLAGEGPTAVAIVGFGVSWTADPVLSALARGVLECEDPSAASCIAQQRARGDVLGADDLILVDPPDGLDPELLRRVIRRERGARAEFRAAWLAAGTGRWASVFLVAERSERWVTVHQVAYDGAIDHRYRLRLRDGRARDRDVQRVARQLLRRIALR